ncbi:MAG: hypothetical protein IV108_02995 [Burkholderiales bacterium]|nr:hypothetical protein [Burkholderiales bacterium]
MNHDPFSAYAPRLSSEEYQQAVAALYRRVAEAPLPGAQGDITQALKTAEFNLAIDYKLGRNFPQEKRTALLAAKRRAEKQRLRLAGKFLQKSIRDKAFASGMQVWVEQLAEEFSKILSPQELNAFMELQAGEKPVLPIEADKL